MAGFILKTLKKFRVENSVLKEIGNIPEEEIVIPDGVRVIGKKVFFEQKQIKKVIIPKTVSIIDYRAFSYCENLEEIEIPDSVKELGEYCFAGCTNLKKVKLPASLKIIKKNTFAWCKSLEEIELPPFVEVIGEQAFHGCENLRTVSFGSSVGIIKRGAFSACESLKEVILPQSVKYIEANAFFLCENLEKIQILGEFEEAGYNAFCKTKTKRVDVLIDGELKYILPNDFYKISLKKRNYESSFKYLDSNLKIEAALLRLKVNYHLTEEYREKYIAYLKNHFNEVVIYCVDNHFDDIAICEEIGLFENQENILVGIDYANQIQNIDMAAFLMNYYHEHFDKSENFLDLEEL